MWSSKLSLFSLSSLLALAITAGATRDESATVALADLDDPGRAFAWGDFDGDLLPDVFVIGTNGGRLFKNGGGARFTDVTERTGLTNAGAPNAALWQDADLDGDLDLFLPAANGATRLFVNEDGAFEDATRDAGLELPGHVARARWIDVDRDGLADLHLTHDGQVLLYHNLGERRFERSSFELASEAGTMPVVVLDGAERAAPDAARSAVAPSAPGASGASSQLGMGASNGPTPLGSGTQAGGKLPAGGTCVESMRDQAVPDNCMSASSTPALGMLYPITEDLFVDTLGRVGMGTTTPAVKLDARGTVRGTAPDSSSFGELGTEDVGVRASGATFAGQFLGDVLVDDGRYIAKDDTGTTTARIDSFNANFWNAGGGALRLYDRQGDLGVNIVADEFINEPSISMIDAAGRSTVRIEANSIGGGGGGSIGLMDSAGNGTIRLEAESGTTTTKVLTITGGADIAEPFDVSTEAPAGTVLCIDPEEVGKLCVSKGAYDRTLAGVASGANGIDAGLVLRQDDSIATGSVLVALTGRVYVRCSAENGAIRPGDLLTSASLEGHAMKATDTERSFGSVLGKAMSSLDEGTGMVLVLINLQ